MAVNNNSLYIAHLCLSVKTNAQWTAENPVLLAGETALESDTLRMKIGTGHDTWTALPYTDEALRNRLDNLEALALAQVNMLNALMKKLEQEEAY